MAVGTNSGVVSNGAVTTKYAKQRQAVSTEEN